VYKSSRSSSIIDKIKDLYNVSFIGTLYHSVEVIS
jgi:hypothetical protein